MIDQSHINLLSLIPSPLKHAASTGGGEYHGACPFCGGEDRFVVWPKHDNGGRWWCRQCNREGDALAFLMDYKSLTFEQACAELRCSVPDHEPARPKSQTVQPDLHVGDLKDYPCFEPDWQRSAEDFAYACAGRLWDDWRGRAGQYLERRGIGKNNAVAAFLGVNPGFYQSAWGSVEVKLPRGITIPWIIDDGTLWNIRVRRPNADMKSPKDDKYISAKGCANGMYGIGLVRPGDKVVMTEGEFDLLVLKDYLLQRGREDITVVSIGSNTGAHVLRWVTRLSLASKVYLAFDQDTAGETAAVWWQMRLGRKAVRICPTRKDITDMYLAGELAYLVKEVA